MAFSDSGSRLMAFSARRILIGYKFVVMEFSGSILHFDGSLGRNDVLIWKSGEEIINF